MLSKWKSIGGERVLEGPTPLPDMHNRKEYRPYLRTLAKKNKRRARLWEQYGKPKRTDKIDSVGIWAARIVYHHNKEEWERLHGKHKNSQHIVKCLCRIAHYFKAEVETS